MRKVLLALFVSVVVLVTGGQAPKYIWHLGFVPAGLNVGLILYTKEDAWGFGPGGNETGVIVYELPEHAADRVAAGGGKYLAELSNADGSGSRGHYRNWRTTPIAGEETWLHRDGTGKPWHAGHRPSIADYLNKYGFGIQIDADIPALIDDALWSPGNYYAYGPGGGLIIVAPNLRRIIYAYAG